MRDSTPVTAPIAPAAAQEAVTTQAPAAAKGRRCEAALLVAAQCGKFAGTFYCDEKGFKAIAAEDSVRPAALGNAARQKMERCALDAARRNP